MAEENETTRRGDAADPTVDEAEEAARTEGEDPSRSEGAGDPARSAEPAAALMPEAGPDAEPPVPGEEAAEEPSLEAPEAPSSEDLEAGRRDEPGGAEDAAIHIEAEAGEEQAALEDSPAEESEEPIEAEEGAGDETGSPSEVAPGGEAPGPAQAGAAGAPSAVSESTDQVSESTDQVSESTDQVSESTHVASPPAAETVSAPSAEAESAPAEPREGGDAAAGDGDPFGGPGDWYVVHTYAGYENKVKTNLSSRIHSMQMEDKIFDVVIPMEDVMEIKGGKKQVVQKKVFPGYLLVKMVYDDDSWFVVRNTPGVTGFVSSGTGQRPTPLSRGEVEKILAVKKKEEKPSFRLEFEEGDVVRIISGPFADFNGTISDINVDQSKVRVMVNIFDRETPVELSFDQVARV